jgi:uracil-DNA glycosylase
MASRAEDFRLLQQEIVNCRDCPRLVEWRELVAAQKVRRFRECEYWGRPVPSFGSVDARLLVVGLAPAAHGGNRTGRMFTGDSSGDWLYEALHRFGFASQAESHACGDGMETPGCLITAAARCAPPDNKPTAAELEKCRRFLRRELELASCLRAVVSLGRIGFEAFLRAWTELHGPLPSRPVFAHGAQSELHGGVVLISSYHPSRQNTQTLRLTREMFHEVFRMAREAVGGGDRN